MACGKSDKRRCGVVGWQAGCPAPAAVRQIQAMQHAHVHAAVWIHPDAVQVMR